MESVRVTDSANIYNIRCLPAVQGLTRLQIRRCACWSRIVHVTTMIHLPQRNCFDSKDRLSLYYDLFFTEIVASITTSRPPPQENGEILFHMPSPWILSDPWRQMS